MVNVMQLFLPTQNRCPLRFLQQIIRDDKRVLQRQNIPRVFVSNWPELGVRMIWPQAVRIEGFLEHMPDGWDGVHKTERKFFYGVLTSLAPNFVQAVVNEARQLRYQHRLGREAPQRQMQISGNWAEMLLRQPFASGK